MWRLLFLASSLGVLVAAYDPPRQYYVEVPWKSREQLASLRDAGFDIGGVNFENRTISLVVDEDKLFTLRNQQILSRRAITLAPDQQFKSPDEIASIVDEAEKNYPQLVNVEAIGKSGEGRDILAVNLTNRMIRPEEGEKPAVVFDCMHHAREVMTPEVGLDIIEYLTKNYGKDEKVTKWMNEYSIWVIPMLNPDGNNKVWNQQAMWRKNTTGGHGVDINRNYTYAWNSCQGSSGNKNADDYRGPSPGSEPETQVIMNFNGRIKPKFNISYHSYSEIVIYPMGCSPKRIPEPDRTIYERIGRELAGKLVRDSGKGTYEPGTSYELLYDVDGGSIDWMYTQHKIMSFVIEMNSSSQGFQPSFSKWREATVEKQRPGWMYILDQMDQPGIRP